MEIFDKLMKDSKGMIGISQALVAGRTAIDCVIKEAQEIPMKYPNSPLTRSAAYGRAENAITLGALLGLYTAQDTAKQLVILKDLLDKEVANEQAAKLF